MRRSAEGAVSHIVVRMYDSEGAEVDKESVLSPGLYSFYVSLFGLIEEITDLNAPSPSIGFGLSSSMITTLGEKIDLGYCYEQSSITDSPIEIMIGSIQIPTEGTLSYRLHCYTGKNEEPNYLAFTELVSHKVDSRS